MPVLGQRRELVAQGTETVTLLTQQATIDRQLETIAELSAKATINQHTEQLNRELSNRSENLQQELATLKQRTKALQKDLGEAREQIKVLTQYDPVRMKKNLDVSKKKLVEQTLVRQR